MSATLDKIKEEVKTLGADELHQVRDLVDSLLSEPDGSRVNEDELEDAFERELAAEGFISPVRPLTATDEEVRQYRAYKPITVEGQPLSEMIVEERR
jgi:hypothetical protein